MFILGAVILGAAFGVMGLVLLFMAGRSSQVAPEAGDSCAGCGYSLAGLPKDKSCPECGSSNRVLTTPGSARLSRKLARAAGFGWSVLCAAACLVLLSFLSETPLLEGVGFSAAFILPPFLAVALVIALVGRRAPPVGMLTTIVLTTLFMLASLALLFIDAFVFHPDAQGGLVLLFAPLSPSIGGYGLFLGGLTADIHATRTPGDTQQVPQ